MRLTMPLVVMICSSLRALVYPTSFSRLSVSWISRTVDGPRDQRIWRIASSEGVGWILGSCFMGREATTKTFVMSTKTFVLRPGRRLGRLARRDTRRRPAGGQMTNSTHSLLTKLSGVGGSRTTTMKTWIGWLLIGGVVLGGCQREQVSQE